MLGLSTGLNVCTGMWEVNRTYLQIISNMGNAGLRTFSFNYLASFFKLTIKGNHYLAARVLTTLNRHIYCTAPSLLTHCHISFHTPIGEVLLLSIAELGFPPNFHNLTGKSCIIKIKICICIGSTDAVWNSLIATY